MEGLVRCLQKAIGSMRANILKLILDKTEVLLVSDKFAPGGRFIAGGFCWTLAAVGGLGLFALSFLPLSTPADTPATAILWKA